MPKSTPRILVCGSGGLLGGALLRAAARRPGARVVGLTRAQLDLTDAVAVRMALSTQRPDVVINAAAFTQVDAAEREPSKANVGCVVTAATIARETARSGARLLHVSTDYVFDGRLRRPYRPDDPARPLSAYGRAKLQGEEWVRREQPAHWIVRTAGLFGDQRGFVDAVARRALAGEPLRVVDDQIAARTYVEDLAPALLELATRGAAWGTYHLTNPGGSSWYEFARVILEILGTSAPLTPVSSEAYAAPAPRPAYSVLDLQAWRAVGLPEPRSIDEALAEYLRRPTAPTAAGEETGDA